MTNAAGRDATIDFVGLKGDKPPRLGLPHKEVRFARYLATTDEGLHDALQRQFGEDYADALIAGDPELDVERIGQAIKETNAVYLSADGEVLHAPPEWVEVIFAPDGSEKERREPEDVEANVNDEMPVRWTGAKMPRATVARKFVFDRTLQIRHVDGLTFDYLYGMAQELDEADQVVLVAGGPKGRDPLIFNRNGSPYRGFLEGRIDGDRYQLLLHLSNMELKRPAADGSGS
jgi:hypothetical protein